MKRNKNPIIRILAESKKQWIGIVLIILSSTLSGILQSNASKIWGSVIDLGISGETKEMINSVIFMMVLLVAECVRTPLHYTLNAMTTESMFMSLRLRAFKTLTQGDVGYLEKRMRSGDLSVRINSDLESLCEIFAGQYTWFLQVILQASIAVIYCVSLSWQLSLIYFPLIPVSTYIIKKISLPIQEQQKETSSSNGRAMNLVVDIINGLMIVKSFQLEKIMHNKFSKAVDNAVSQSIKSEKVSIKMTAVKYLVTIIQLLTLFSVGTLLVYKGYITVGTVVAFVTISTSVRTAFELSDRMVMSIRRSVALGERIYEVIDIPLETSGSKTKAENTEQYVKIDSLSYNYEGKKSLFNNLSLHINKGDKVALIGPSGCGKSTITKLICKFYSHKNGDIILFGNKASDWDTDKLREKLAIVTQEPYLFDGTIYENVLYGNQNATQEEVFKVLKDAQLWEFVSSLENGVYTKIGEQGSNLSGGQKQRLSVARAIIKNADLIILDEATSALDVESEFEIQCAINELIKDKTAIIIAHRLSTIENVDYIYCIDDGKIVEEGSPMELLRLKGYYYKMQLQQNKDFHKGGDVIVDF